MKLLLTMHSLSTDIGRLFHVKSKPTHRMRTLVRIVHSPSIGPFAYSTLGRHLHAKGALLGYAGAARKACRRRAGLSDQKDTPLAPELVFGLDAAPEHERGILEGDAFPSIHRSALENRYAAGCDEGQE